MSDNLDFMAIFGGEGSLDLGSGGEDFDALFAEKEAPQPPEEKASETTEVSQPEETPAETPEPEQSKEDANAPEEEKPETPPQPAAAPEKKPAAPKVSGKPAASPANPFEAAMRQVEEKITQDLAGELLQKPPVFQFGGVTEEIADPKKTFEQLRKEKEADFPELEDGKRVSWTMEYGKLSKTRIFADIPIDPDWNNLLHYADIHSHNSMAARFSEIDDEDEKANRLYLVMGRLDQYFPEVSARICNGGTFLSIYPGDVLEGVPREFPSWWNGRVKLLEDSVPITGEEEGYSWKGAMAA